MAVHTNAAEKLALPLDTKRIKRREGAGKRALDYLETHDVIRTANDIFGFGGWGHEIVDLTLIAVEPTSSTWNGKTKEGHRVGYRCTVRLTVDGAVPVCGVGYGDAVEYTGSQITPHELAAKEAESDALKRAFKNFGDQFGLVLYAKDADRAAHTSSGAADRPTNGGAAGAGSSPATAPDPGGHRAALKVAIVNAAEAHGHTAEQVASRLLRSYGAKELTDLTGVQLIEAKRKLETWERHAEGTAA